MPSLENFTVVVTGAAGGLGKAIATAFLEAGANAAICDVSAERIEATSSEWEAAHANRFLASRTDITDEAAVTGFIGEVVGKFGKVDMLVNNAGIMDRFDPVGETDKALWDRVMGVNVTGAFLATKAAVNAMAPRGAGTIINIGSIASYRGLAAGAAYTASKHALAGLNKNTASFYGAKGLSSIILYLGGMDTNITDFMRTNPPNMEGMKRQAEQMPGYVQGETNVKVEDVAKYCLFFANGDLARVSNGAEITVNKNWPAV